MIGRPEARGPQDRKSYVGWRKTNFAQARVYSWIVPIYTWELWGKGVFPRNGGNVAITALSRGIAPKPCGNSFLGTVVPIPLLVPCDAGRSQKAVAGR